MSTAGGLGLTLAYARSADDSNLSLRLRGYFSQDIVCRLMLTCWAHEVAHNITNQA